MASIFRFRTRSPRRDAETDRLRASRLQMLVDEISQEIADERMGLENRYRKVAADAGFAVEAMANDELPAVSGGRVDELTTAVLNCERRLAKLSRQSERLRELQRLVALFAAPEGPSD